MQPEFDAILVGGGLQNALMTLALLNRDPTARIAIIERTHRLGGNHTWSTHATDIPPESERWIAPLIAKRWPDYDVHFPGESRRIAIGYAALSSDLLHEVIRRIAESANVRIVFGCEAISLSETAVHLDGGLELTARLVIDGRGPIERYTDCGYQKFFAQEVELVEPPEIARPVVMDACVAQDEGFRFLYLLPFTPTRLLVEDTYFTDSPALDLDEYRRRVVDYIAGRGWRIAKVHREEQGVLPMPWKGVDPTPGRTGPLAVGYRGGWMHPATCYSLPIAIRLAQLIADAYPNRPFGPRLTAFAREHKRQARFSRLLNYLLFRGFSPEDRWHVFARFYRLPVDVIARFFSLQMTRADRARILCGRPPRGFSVRRFLGKRG